MRLKSDAHLDWHDNEPATKHTIDCDLAVDLLDIFLTDDPVTELAVRGVEIRRQLTSLLAEQTLPKLLADMGKPTATPGRLRTNWETQSRATWRFSRQAPGGGGPALRGDAKITIGVGTDRAVHALQALEGTRAGVAEGIADLLMGSLRFHLHGTPSTRTTSRVRTENGRVTEYEVDERTGGDVEKN